jgi:hypothetical protein
LPLAFSFSTLHIHLVNTKTVEQDMVGAVATKALNELGFAPRRVNWLGGKTFEATFRLDVDAATCARKLRAMGRTADAKPARFDDDAFVAFVL